MGMIRPRLSAACQTGVTCKVNGSKLPAEDNADSDITVRATLIRLLIMGGTPGCGLHERGVRLVGARINGQLACEGASLGEDDDVALHAQSLRVAKGFIFREMKAVRGIVNLSSAHVGDLVDDAAAWMECDPILEGFSYDRVGGHSSPKTFVGRKGWLEKGARYTQFALVMRAARHAGGARKTLVERDRLLAGEARKITRWWDYVAWPFHFIWDTLLRLIAGYGYAPARSIMALGVLLALAWGMASLAWQEGSFAPNSDVILVSPGWQDLLAKDCLPEPAREGCTLNPASAWSNDPQAGMDWDSFSAFGYAADLVVPILDLGQTSAWAPTKDRGTWGWGLWWGRWVFAALGWLVTALGAAAVTGVIQRNSPD